MCIADVGVIVNDGVCRTACPTACDYHQKLIRNLVRVLANKILLTVSSWRIFSAWNALPCRWSFPSCKRKGCWSPSGIIFSC